MGKFLPRYFPYSWGGGSILGDCQSAAAPGPWVDPTPGCTGDGGPKCSPRSVICGVIGRVAQPRDRGFGFLQAAKAMGKSSTHKCCCGSFWGGSWATGRARTCPGQLRT